MQHDDLTPRESLALIEHQQEVLQRRLGASPARYFLPWGIAYLLGFAALYAAYDTDLPFRLPWLAAGVILSVLFGAALAVSVTLGSRVAQGLQGPTRTSAAMVNLSWPLGFLGMTLLNAGISRRGLTDETQTLLWTGTSLLVVGLLQLTAAVSTQDRVTYALGTWVLLTAGVSVLAGVPSNFAVLSLMGGGGMLVAAAWSARGRTA